MLAIVLLVLALAMTSVPLAGGRLGKLADLRLARPWLLGASFVLQFAIFRLVPHGPQGVLAVLHIGSYVLAGIFLWSNRGVPFLWVAGLGGAMNFAAIGANGGVMPAGREAIVSARLSQASGGFVNSGVVSNPQLSFLGDVFTLPGWSPIHNVFSLGDVCIAIGALILVHRVCGSRLVPSGRGDFSALISHRDFGRLWLAQAVSNLGDWIYALGVAASIVERNGPRHALAFLLVAQVGPAALAGLFGGPLIDRYSRKTVMIVSDVMRAVAVASLLLAGPPSVGHLYVVAACLGIFEAVFQPSLQASLPNLVPKERLVAANALVGATFNFAMMGGPILGGLLVAHMGLGGVLTLNASSFLVSGALVAVSRIPRTRSSSEVGNPLKNLHVGLRHALSTPLVRSVLLIVGLVMFAAAVRSPLEPVLVLDAFDQSIRSLGLVGGAWGVGMVLGAAVAPAAARRWSRRKLLALSVVAVGLAVMAASQAASFRVMLACWVVCGLGNALGTVCYESMLQERTPDSLRGRVIAASESVLNLTYLMGAATSAWLAGFMHVRMIFMLSGVFFVAIGWLARHLLSDERVLSATETVTDSRVPAAI
jgi:MFS transporter, DHA3 family, macrolide efflux protein